MCFTHMLQVFHLDVVYILQWLHTCFPRVSTILDVVKVDLMLHLHMFVVGPSAVAASCWARLHASGCEGGASSRQETVRAQIEMEQTWDTERGGT
jgi:hypothetical protein